MVAVGVYCSMDVLAAPTLLAHDDHREKRRALLIDNVLRILTVEWRLD